MPVFKLGDIFAWEQHWIITEGNRGSILISMKSMAKLPMISVVPKGGYLRIYSCFELFDMVHVEYRFVSLGLKEFDQDKNGL